MINKKNTNFIIMIFMTFLFFANYKVVADEIASDSNVSSFLRDDEQETVYDSNRNLIWQDDKLVTTIKKSWHGAIEYCGNLDLAQFSDWRLPNRAELLSITDKTKKNPAIKSEFKNVISDGYWSRSSHIGDLTYAWVVYFYYGGDAWGEKRYDRFVRCVRNND